MPLIPFARLGILQSACCAYLPLYRLPVELSAGRLPRSPLPDMPDKAAFAQILPLDAGNKEEGASGM